MRSNQKFYLTTLCFKLNCRRLLSTTKEFDYVEYSMRANSRIRELSKISPREETLLLDRRVDHNELTKFNRSANVNKTIFAIDNVADEKECRTLCALLANSDLQSFMVSPGERKISGDSSVLEYVLPDHTLATLDYLKRKMHKIVQMQINEQVPLYEAGSIISWLSPPYAINTGSHSRERVREDSRASGRGSVAEPVQHMLPVDVIAPEEGTYSYWSAHCDKANNNEYDLSALLYLNSDFRGGDLLFLEAEGDAVVQPKRGRLVVFNSCIDNIHRVRAVTEGNRFLLSVWYSRQRYR